MTTMAFPLVGLVIVSRRPGAMRVAGPVGSRRGPERAAIASWLLIGLHLAGMSVRLVLAFGQGLGRIYSGSPLDVAIVALWLWVRAPEGDR
jgi:hypothetical protein